MSKNEEREEQLIETIDDEGNVINFELIDIVEMLCDWRAAAARQLDGNLLKSIEVNAERFGYGEQLKQIFINTAKMFDEQT